ncbi:CLUMA_CG005881, isoform A [Clunio marinus]|uniref:CLUMA_CG005881, isoform A n=1 Tax=Clunio marinus TaxID=568069 RepID=A0A1J1HWC8_9DIPT|nr:CLUMA_CG005881, isoform A [Clunio marinus]
MVDFDSLQNENIHKCRVWGSDVDVDEQPSLLLLCRLVVNEKFIKFPDFHLQPVNLSREQKLSLNLLFSDGFPFF